MPTQVGPSWEVPFEQYTDGQNEAVSAASQGRIRYNNATVAFEGSVNGGAYVAFAAGGVGSLDASYNVGRFIFADAGVVDIQNNGANNTGCMLLEKVPAAAQSGNVLEILVGPNASGDGIQIDSTGTGVMIDGNFTGAVASGGFAQYTDNGTFAGAGQFMFSGTNANDARTTRAIYYAENQGNAFDAAMFRGASSGSSTTARGLLLSDDGTGIGTQPFVELAGTNNAATSCMLRIGASGAAALRNYVEFDATNTAVVAVSAASEGRLAYDSVANQFVVSENGGAWSSIVGGGTLQNAYNFGGLGAGREINALNGAVTIDASNAANQCILAEKNSGALDASPLVTLSDAGVGANTVPMLQFTGNNNVRTGPCLSLEMTGAANLTNYIRFGLCDTSAALVAPVQTGQIAVDSGDGLFKASRNGGNWLNMIIGNASAAYTFTNAPAVGRTIDCNSFDLNDLVQIVFTMHSDLNAINILG